MKIPPEAIPFCWSKKLGTQQSNQNFFSLLLEIESRLRREARNERLKQRNLSNEKDQKRTAGR
jgi:hypothetical protein